MISSFVSQAAAVIGTVVLFKATYDFISFLHFHFLSPPTYTRLLHGKAPYALVTGASDGIGKAVAKELYGKGFNVIVHGRNSDKLKKAQAEIMASSSADRTVRLWVADARASDNDFGPAVEEWNDIEITLVVHNVGGTEMANVSIDSIPEETLLSDLRLNATFPYLLTRALLPKLRKTSESGPVQIIFLGSLASDLPVPGLNPYGPAKACVRQMSRLIGAEERALHPRSGVWTTFLQVAEVSSGSHRSAVTLLGPSAATYAKSVVHKVGRTHPAIVPYVWHAVQVWAMGLLPESIIVRAAASAAAAEQERMAKEA